MNAWWYRLLDGMMDMKKEVAVLDLGTSKVCCAIAKNGQKSLDSESINSGREIRVLGVGNQLAKGIKRGALTNLEELEDALLSAISSSEKDAQKSIHSVCMAIPSWVLDSCNVQTSIDLGQTPVDDVHINALLNFDSSKHVDSSSKIIHVFPVSYILDGVSGIQDPIGMVGSKLSVVLHVMTAPKTFIQNVTNCLNRNNIDIEFFVSSTYASGLSVLLEEEISSGVTLIDIGGSTTSIACFSEGQLLYLDFIPIGGQDVTNDIAKVLNTTRSHAERLKILYGVATGGATLDEEQILVPRIDEYGEEHIQNISKSYLDFIIRSRLEEIIESVERSIYSNILDTSMFQRIVITGGGSRISGLNELIKSNRNFSASSVRLGKPIGTVGSHDFVQTASFAASAGAVLYCLGQFMNASASKFSLTGKKSFRQRIITWFKRGV